MKFAKTLWVYILSLIVAIALLVFWVLYIVFSSQTINELGSKLGQVGQSFHWIVLALGCILFVVLIVGLSLQLVQNLSEIRYSRKLSDFMANITHELKTPLAAIQLHTQTLQNQDLNQNQNESLKYIFNQTKRMNHLVMDLLEATRLEQKQPKADFTLIDLQEFSKNYFPELTERVVKQGYDLQVQSKSQSQVLGHPLYLERILNNLIDNAIKANPNQKNLVITLKDQSGKVVIHVIDDGEAPIPKTEQKKIFDRFYQTGQEIHNERKGAGLGLFIVKELVESMRGKIQLKHSSKATGTCFEIQFPKAKA